MFRYTEHTSSPVKDLRDIVQHDGDVIDEGPDRKLSVCSFTYREQYSPPLVFSSKISHYILHSSLLCFNTGSHVSLSTIKDYVLSLLL